MTGAFPASCGAVSYTHLFFTPRFTLECSDWEVNGSFMEWDYTIDSASRGCIASITKELFHWTDTLSLIHI